MEDQPWQADAPLDVDAFDFSTSSDAAYKVKIEGRLLDDDMDGVLSDDSDDEEADVDAMDEGTRKKSRTPETKSRLSHFFKTITIDFGATSARDNSDSRIEWKKPNPSSSREAGATAEFDVLEFKRSGDENVNITISLTLDEAPERFTLSPALAEILDASETTRAEAVTGIWQYIRAMGLQEDEEKRSFRCDDSLRQVRHKHATSF